MQRDMELIRKIFAEVRARQNLERREVTIEGYDELIVNRHVEMLISKKYLEGFCNELLNDESVHCLVRDITMDGHDFSAVIENDGVWKKLKESWTAAEFASVPLSVVKEIGTSLLKQYLMQKAGLSDS